MSAIRQENWVEGMAGKTVMLSAPIGIPLTASRVVDYLSAGPKKESNDHLFRMLFGEATRR